MGGPRAGHQGSPGGAAGDFSLTFVIPSYNRYHSLCRLLSSLRRAAASAELRVIVVDDGSRDATRDLRGDEVVTVLHQQNAGPAVARNNGARAARTTFLAFVDDDCELAADYVQRAREEATGRGGVVFGGPALPLEVPGRSPSLAGRYLRASRMLQDPITDKDGRVICLPSANLVIRRDVFWASGGFFESITRAGGEDAHLTLRLRELGFPCRFLHDLVVYHDVDLGLLELLRKFYRYGVGAAWTASSLGLSPEVVGLITTDWSAAARAPLEHALRLLAYTRYLQRTVWIEHLPLHQRIAVGSLAYGESLSGFLGGLAGGRAARSEGAAGPGGLTAATP